MSGSPTSAAAAAPADGAAGGAASGPARFTKIGKAAEAQRVADYYTRGEALYDIGMKLLDKPVIPNLKTKLHSVRRVFENAAEAFLAAGKWRNAAKSYAMCAEMERKLSFEREAAMYFVDAGEYAEKVDHELSLLYYAQAVACLVSVGKFVPAAVVQRRIADVCSEDDGHNEAGRAYGYSADLYLSADELQQAVLMYHRSGVQYVFARQFLDAKQAFERCAAVADDDNMMRYRVPTIMLDACLAYIATGDVPGTEDYVVELSKQNYLFATGKEAKFIFDIIDNAKTVNLDNLMDHIWNFDYVHELQPHQLEVLLRVYKMYVAELDEIETVRREAEDAARTAGRKKLTIKKGGEAAAPEPAAAGAAGAAGGAASGGAGTAR